MLIVDEFLSGAPVRPSADAFLQWGLLASDFDYEPPQELIAQRPLAERGGRMLVVNNSRVLAARLVAKRRPPGGGPLGGAAEILVVEPEDAAAGMWRALVRPSRKLRPGSLVETGWATTKVLGHTGHGMRTIEFPALDGAAVTRLLASRGHVPLPPYIRRDADEADRERYQTVFAREPGSVASNSQFGLFCLGSR